MMNVIGMTMTTMTMMMVKVAVVAKWNFGFSK